MTRSASVPTSPPVDKAARKAPLHPVDKLMAQIEGLEDDLELVESEAPAFLQSVRAAMTPLAGRMADSYRALIAWLGEQSLQPRLAKGMHANIVELAAFLCERAQDQYGVDLEDCLKDAGLWEEPADNEDEDAHSDFQRFVFESIMGSPDDDMPEHIREDLLASIQEKRPPSPEVIAWMHRRNAEQKAQESKPPRGRKPKAGTATLDPEALKKKLYHGLARDLHPDKAALAERDQRTALMQQLNAAYKGGDMRTLLSLLHVHGSAEMKAGVDDETLRQLKSALETQKKDIQARLRNRLQRLPALEGDWLALLRNKEAQAQLLRQERRRGEADIKHFAEVAKYLQGPKELGRFFKQYDADDWNRIF